MQPWRRIDDGGEIQQVGHKCVEMKRFVMNSGKEMVATIANASADMASIVIPITRNNKIVIARQFRCGPERVLDELPGGMVDSGETPQMAAQRELIEETGYQAERLEYIGEAYVNAWSNTIHHFYIGYGCKKVSDAPNPDENEEIEVDEISIAQLLKNAKSANMTDAVGVLLAYDTLKALENK